MSDYMLLEYLRNKGKTGDEYRMLDEFKDYMRSRGRMRGSRRHRDYQWDDMEYSRHDWDDYPMIHHMRSYRDSMPEESFDEFSYQGHKEWEGTKDEVFNATNQRLNDFIFASDLLKKVKEENK